MTDNEIIKALECCRSTSCYDCPYNDENLCIDALLQYALDLINRQKAENERLKDKNAKLRLEMSYMKSPNTIGDIHEMGAW